MVKASAAQVVNGCVNHFGIKNFTGLFGYCFANMMVIDPKTRDVTRIARYDS
jgi:hypothetical protein